RVGDGEVRVRALPVDEPGHDPRGDETRRGEEGGGGPNQPARDEHGGEETECGGAERHERGREREPVDGWRLDHGANAGVLGPVLISQVNVIVFNPTGGFLSSDATRFWSSARACSASCF